MKSKSTKTRVEKGSKFTMSVYEGSDKTVHGMLVTVDEEGGRHTFGVGYLLREDEPSAMISMYLDGELHDEHLYLTIDPVLKGKLLAGFASLRIGTASPDNLVENFSLHIFNMVDKVLNGKTVSLPEILDEVGFNAFLQSGDIQILSAGGPGKTTIMA